MRIAITGPSGSGKRTLAVELARRLVEPGWRVTLRELVWPAFRRAFENRGELPARYAGVRVRRLRSDADVRAFVESLTP